MTLQDIIKFLLCIILFHQFESFAKENFPNGIKKEIASVRADRAFLDFLLGRANLCGVCLCGRSNKYGARFLGGEYTESHEFPWLANILIKSNILISGVLINNHYVLTAASPLIDSTPPEVKVSLGEYDRCNLDISSINISVEHIYIHPQFNLESKAHDLALIRFSRSIKFEKRISPVCLPNAASTYTNQVGTVSGWTVSTTLEESNNRTCRPRKMGLPIMGNNECIKSGINFTRFHDDSGCIGIVGGNSIICNNDAGTSVLYKSYFQTYDIIGIFSDVNECNGAPRAGVYTRIGPHLDWILQQTKDACYCLR
ncbi:vitamin K-dependent protein C-like [Leptopilina heterotoma]|uniref:vitamin K-dependent protein C-like n=1 Tax=Leptopilina heterotoma TaxID=63436 RepID=UPI001CA9C435|nr:vitamin K-dependent protein C-like [Leptopilina heterotoma]